MQPGKLAEKLEGKDFLFTAEYLPSAGTETPGIEALAAVLGKGVVAVNAADNHFGVAMSSLAASLALSNSGIEPVYQVVTRDRNRIALQSDLLGAAYLGIRNVLCLSGYHQATIGNSGAANVFDIDSTQLISLVTRMNEGRLMDGREIRGPFNMLVGAVANPNTKPLELNLIRLKNKVSAGARFIQTQAVFDLDTFKAWLKAALERGITEKAAILAGVLPLESVAQAKHLSETHTDFVIPGEIIDRLTAAGDEQAQKQEGVKIAAGIIKVLRGMPGLRGVHILSGGNEAVLPDLMAAVS